MFIKPLSKNKVICSALRKAGLTAYISRHLHAKTFHKEQDELKINIKDKVFGTSTPEQAKKPLI